MTGVQTCALPIFPITVDATDDLGVGGVALFVNDVLFEPVDFEAPYEFLIPIPTGVSSVKIAALAVDTANQGTFATINLTVVADAPPTVMITSPHSVVNTSDCSSGKRSVCQ